MASGNPVYILLSSAYSIFSISNAAQHLFLYLFFTLFYRHVLYDEAQQIAKFSFLPGGP